jgi:hypothetical protein
MFIFPAWAELECLILFKIMEEKKKFIVFWFVNAAQKTYFVLCKLEGCKIWKTWKSLTRIKYEFIRLFQLEYGFKGYGICIQWHWLLLFSMIPSQIILTSVFTSIQQGFVYGFEGSALRL